MSNPAKEPAATPRHSQPLPRRRSKSTYLPIFIFRK